MKNENFGLVAGLVGLASITAIWVGHYAIGISLGTISIVFAIRLGLSKRDKG
ncbi:hypothetical protein D3C80_176400 [compost metagenome]